jgi:hypothetical protein
MSTAQLSQGISQVDSDGYMDIIEDDLFGDIRVTPTVREGRIVAGVDETELFELAADNGALWAR